MAGRVGGLAEADYGAKPTDGLIGQGEERKGLGVTCPSHRRSKCVDARIETKPEGGRELSPHGRQAREGRPKGARWALRTGPLQERRRGTLPSMPDGGIDWIAKPGGHRFAGD